MESESGRPSGIPKQLGAFVGRRRELADLEALIASDRLVTLTGTGGSGKTRVALEVAATLGGRFPNGVFFVDLAPIRDPDLVLATIAAALGVRRHPRRTVMDTLIGSIGDRRLFLILDNLEQLRGAEPAIGELLESCPHLHVLATSRAPLHIRGEREYRIGPLAIPDGEDAVMSLTELARIESIALFIERARAIDGAFELTDANAPAIAGICRRLDGLPLAVELAAARSRLLAPEALLRRLDQRLALLISGAADAPARQRTLRDTIAWSYDLLEPADRVLFARVGVFVGGFDLAAGEAILGGATDATEADLLDALGRLVDQSLLRVGSDSEGEPRFGLLETIREFALERLDPDEAEAVRRRHAEYFAAFAETAASELGGYGHRPLPPGERMAIEGVDQARWLDRVSRDIDNLRAAFEYARERGEATLLARLAVALATFFGDFGDHREGGNWLHAAEQRASSLEPPLRADLLFQVATYEIWHGGDRARVRELYAECLAIRESLADSVGAAFALIQISAVAADLGHRAESIELQRGALAVVSRVDDPVDAARLFVWFGLASALLDPAEARSIAEEAIARGRAVGDRLTIARGCVSLGWSALMTGDLPTAMSALSEARTLFADLSARGETAHVISTLGVATLRSGDAESARQLIREGCARARAAEVWVVLATLEAAADWLGSNGLADAATVCWAVVDAARARAPDRTWGNDVGFYEPSRARDRRALRPGAYEAARERGARMTLDEGLDHAIEALDRAAALSEEDRLAASARRSRHDLTPREREVLGLIAAGRSDGEIADALFISKKTASVHVASIKGKLGASSRVEMAMLARGIAPIDDSLAAGDGERPR
jgi:predicted ATPase/DNA-binding CsgD family transcriptional regulator